MMMTSLILISVAYFPEYAKVLFDKYYKDTNNIIPSSSKSNKVRWFNIVQLKFIFLMPPWMSNPKKGHHEWG